MEVNLKFFKNLKVQVVLPASTILGIVPGSNLNLAAILRDLAEKTGSLNLHETKFAVNFAGNSLYKVCEFVTKFLVKFPPNFSNKECTSEVVNKLWNLMMKSELKLTVDTM